MNCKPGDLAIVVKSCAGNEGRIVKCIKLISTSNKYLGADGVVIKDAKWEIDQPLPNWTGFSDFTCPDSILKPIRDNGEDARDETLTWLSVPSLQSETA